MIERVNKVIDEKIRPKLIGHSGDIKVVRVKDDVVEVKLLGACSGCPSAQITLEDVIKADLLEEIPELQDVVMVNEISQDLVDMAKKILHKDR